MYMYIHPNLHEAEIQLPTLGALQLWAAATIVASLRSGDGARRLRLWFHRDLTTALGCDCAKQLAVLGRNGGDDYL